MTDGPQRATPPEQMLARRALRWCAAHASWIHPALARWLPTPSPIHLTLYGKPGCHLCEDAEALLASVKNRYPIVIHTVDIRSDAALFRHFDIRIPVIVLDDGSELSAPLHKVDLDHMLQNRARAGRGPVP